MCVSSLKNAACPCSLGEIRCAGSPSCSRQSYCHNEAEAGHDDRQSNGACGHRPLSYRRRSCHMMYILTASPINKLRRSVEYSQEPFSLRSFLPCRAESPLSVFLKEGLLLLFKDSSCLISFQSFLLNPFPLVYCHAFHLADCYSSRRCCPQRPCPVRQRCDDSILGMSQ